jgi:predicted enzyme related to lactoylglutathione lyase
MSRPIHFEIQADDLERAKRFYADVFGWTYDDWSAVTGSPYWGVHTGDAAEPGIDGGLMPRPASVPGDGAATNAGILTMGVDDFDAAAATIEAAGGRLAQGKTALPGMAWQGYYLDTEGNRFGIHQPDPDAA